MTARHPRHPSRRFALFLWVGFCNAFLPSPLSSRNRLITASSVKGSSVRKQLQSSGDSSVGSSKHYSVVTGANGYVGREIVHRLLHEGDSSEILCLVRPARVAEEENYWNGKETTQCTVRVLPFDMLDGGESLRCALDCVEGDLIVYHTASVFGPTEDHVQTALDNVKGTEDVVRTVSKFPSCKLVLTSSMAAVRASGQVPRNGKFYTHKDWNTISKLGENWGQSYQWSKAESEKRAWELSKDLNVPMVSICPSFVFGPPSDNKTTNSFSITLVGQWIRGESPVQSRLCVDVRDIAAAHVFAGSEAVDGNRYIVSSESRIPSQAMADSLKSVAMELGLGDPKSITYDTEFDGGAIPIGVKEVDASARLEKDLCGLVCRPVEETMSDMGKALLCAK